ncbi:MAG: hypothetical protein OMM_11811, partial [Candidatus Magnetoglobus multicellularis str. Araruama]
DIVYLQAGESYVNTGEGTDEIHIERGAHEVQAGAGDDLIYIKEGQHTLSGDEGYDIAYLAISSEKEIELKNHQFVYDDIIINVSDTLDMLSVEDDADSTLITSEDHNWGGAGLSLKSEGMIDISAADFVLPKGHLALEGFGIIGDINTEVDTLTIVNKGLAANANIIVKEKDDLQIAGNFNDNAGLVTDHGKIDVILENSDSLLTHRSGKITTGTSGQDISIQADDIDFRAGQDSVSGLGKITITAISDDLTYRVGSAAQTRYGNDYSGGEKDHAMDLSTRDIDALKDGFTQIEIGDDNAKSSMYIGDLEDITFENYLHYKVNGDGVPIQNTTGDPQTYFEDTEFNAKLTEETHLKAGHVRVVGDAQSYETLTIDANLLEIKRANVNNPTQYDSGITASQIILNVKEQMIASGWLIGQDLIDINILETNGTNVLISYNDGLNSFTADQGSSILTTGDNSSIDIDAKASIRLAAGIETKGKNSSITMKSDQGFTVLEGAVISVQADDSTIDLSAGSQFHLDSGAAILSGAEYVSTDGTLTPVKTADNTSISLSSSGEMKLSGSILSAGAISLSATGTTYNHAEYFDTIPGKTLATTTPDAQLIIDLRNGIIPKSLKNLLDENNIVIKDSSTLTATEDYTPFEKLTTEQQTALAEKLGYTVYEPTTYYKPDAAEDKRLISTFIQGLVPDYNNADIDWGEVEAPLAETSFEDLTQDQKDVVIAALGYAVYEGTVYYN